MSFTDEEWAEEYSRRRYGWRLQDWDRQKRAIVEAEAKALTRYDLFRDSPPEIAPRESHGERARRCDADHYCDWCGATWRVDHYCRGGSALCGGHSHPKVALK